MKMYRTVLLTAGPQPGTGSSYKKRICQAVVSQRLRTTGIEKWDWHANLKSDTKS